MVTRQEWFEVEVSTEDATARLRPESGRAPRPRSWAPPLPADRVPVAPPSAPRPISGWRVAPPGASASSARPSSVPPPQVVAVRPSVPMPASWARSPVESRVPVRPTIPPPRYDVPIFASPAALPPRFAPSERRIAMYEREESSARLRAGGAGRWVVALALLVFVGAAGAARYRPQWLPPAASKAVGRVGTAVAAYVAQARGAAPVGTAASIDPARGAAGSPVTPSNSEPANGLTPAKTIASPVAAGLGASPSPSGASTVAGSPARGTEPPLVSVSSLPLARDWGAPKDAQRAHGRGPTDGADALTSAPPPRSHRRPAWRPVAAPSAPSRSAAPASTSPADRNEAEPTAPVVRRATAAPAPAPAPGSLDDLIRKAVESESKKKP